MFLRDSQFQINLFVLVILYMKISSSGARQPVSGFTKVPDNPWSDVSSNHHPITSNDAHVVEYSLVDVVI